MFIKIIYLTFFDLISASFVNEINRTNSKNYTEEQPETIYKLKCVDNFNKFSIYCFYTAESLEKRIDTNNLLAIFNEVCGCGTIEIAKDFLRSQYFFNAFKTDILTFITMLREDTKIKIYDKIYDLSHVFEVFPANFGLYRFIDERMTYIDTGNSIFLLNGIYCWKRLLTSIINYRRACKTYINDQTLLNSQALSNIKKDIYFNCLNNLNRIIFFSISGLYSDEITSIENLLYIMQHYTNSQKFDQAQTQDSDLKSLYDLFWPILLISKNNVWDYERYLIFNYESLNPNPQYRFNYNERKNSTNPLRRYPATNIYDNIKYVFFEEIKKYKYLVPDGCWENLEEEFENLIKNINYDGTEFDKIIYKYKNMLKNIINK